MPEWSFSLANSLFKALVILHFILLSVLFLVWLERKVCARFQNRLGPMRVGRPHGWLQTLADVLKLLVKEDIIPESADRWLFRLAPVLVFVPSMMLFVVIPFGPGMAVYSLDVGLLYLVAVTSISVLGLIMAGWGSNNKWSVLAAMRTAAEVITYEVPLALAVLGVAMLAGSLNLERIVEAQAGGRWFILVQPLGFVVYLIAMTAELRRTPFDLSEAESELVAGYNVEYSAMRWSFFMLAEFGALVGFSGVAVTLYLGGWHGPWLPPVAWFLLKTFGLILFIMWVRWTLPRIRIDQLMDLGWKFLIPVALVNIAVTGVYLVVM
ncbi:MAG: NADH-quinone oxidoreductase subunit NuoH [Firmicutes bacterium]|nr:NADH-quinone oxidoreductase subunit NuoH [Bacillota bacterium]